MTAPLRKLKIGYRLALGFTLMLLLMAVVTAMSLVLTSGPRNAVEKAVSLANEKSMLITSMRQNIIRQGLLAHDIGFPRSNDIDAPLNDMRQIKREQQQYEQSGTALRNLPLSRAETDILDKLGSHDAVIRPILADAGEWVDAYNPGQASRVMADKATQPQQASIELLNFLNHLQNVQIQSQMQQFNAASTAANRTLVAGTALVLALAIVIAWLLTQSIVKPLTEAVNAARRVADGDLDYRPAVTDRDEPGQLLSALANMIARLKEARRLLEQAARQDGLTGLANRRHFDERLQHEWQRLSRLSRLTQEPDFAAGSAAQLSLLLIDVDFFKKFNDTYGHQTGDTCLRVVAGVIGSTGQRQGDVAARYGGEEFAVILPGADAQGARAVAERIREEMMRQTIPGVDTTITVSIGVATVVPGAAQGPSQSPSQSPAHMIAAADAALYEAKHQGRNRVCMAA